MRGCTVVLGEMSEQKDGHFFPLCRVEFGNEGVFCDPSGDPLRKSIHVTSEIPKGFYNPSRWLTQPRQQAAPRAKSNGDTTGSVAEGPYPGGAAQRWNPSGVLIFAVIFRWYRPARPGLNHRLGLLQASGLREAPSRG